MSKDKATKKVLKGIKLIFINFFIAAISFEFILRVVGIGVFQKFPIQIKSITPQSPMKFDSELGFSLASGEYTYHYSDGYSFSATHTRDGLRSPGFYNPPQQKSIDFYGGSLFYGFGLEDSLVFSSKLQKVLPEYNINNHAIFAHNLVTSLKQISIAIKANNSSELAIVSYASYDLERNVYANNFRKNITGKKNLHYCFARLYDESSQKIEFHLEEFDYEPFFLSNYSALSNFLEGKYNEYEYNSYHPEVVNILIIEQLVELCEKNDINLVFAIVNSDNHTDSMKEYFNDNNIRYVDISVDYMDKKYNLLPHDNHPNGVAHELYKLKLLKYLKDEFKIGVNTHNKK